jgi:hypothetical protein
LSKLLQLDPKIDLWLSYTWSNNDHGICGHVYEVIDYYMILKDHFNVGILFAEKFELDLSKYDFELDESVITYCDKPSVVKGTNILFVDGGVNSNMNKTLLFDNIFYFACGNKEVKDNDKDNVYILQDDRVYDPVKKNGINYKKRILLDRLNPVVVHDDRPMVYTTTNCRETDLTGLPSNTLVVSDKEYEEFECVKPPVKDIFEKFHTFIYTPVARKWDCSPRFIVECEHHGKEVEYHNIDYWEEDKGLYWRKWDIDNDFDSLYLKEDDEIICIIKQVLSN